MKKSLLVLTALLFTAMILSVSYADEAVNAAKVKFDAAKNAYIAAKQKLSDAQIKSLRTVGKAEKQEAVKAVLDAKKEVKTTKETYKAALSELHKAEMTRDANSPRPKPWK